MAESRERILRFVGEFIQSRGYSPTYREIAAGVGLKSVSTVLRHLEILKDEGRIDYVPTAPRTVHITKEQV